MSNVEQLQTPILFLVFNRPDPTAAVMSQIRGARPKQLFVAADGPRSGKEGEAELCAEVRRIASQVDWPCEVKTLFRDENLGCGRAVSSAIRWFFDSVEEGIILEDDCLPDPSFFSFCQTMLGRYRHTESVCHIGGFNVQDGQKRGSHSYYFSEYFHVWGWATWKRAWSEYEYSPSDYAGFLHERCLENLFEESRIVEFWKKQLDKVFLHGLDTWDYQWVYLNMKRRAMSVVPNVNLVRNIGFGADATHTKNANSAVAKTMSESLAVDDGPEFILPNREADRYTYWHHLRLRPTPPPSKRPLWKRALSRIATYMPSRWTRRSGSVR